MKSLSESIVEFEDNEVNEGLENISELLANDVANLVKTVRILRKKINKEIPRPGFDKKEAEEVRQKAEKALFELTSILDS